MGPMNILVAEDDPQAGHALERLLRGWGYGVVRAAHVEEAVAVLDRDQAPAMVLLAKALPGGGGLELCRRIRQAHREAYVMMLATSADGAARRAADEAGADDLLARPFDVDVLRLRLAAGPGWVALRKGSPAPAGDQTARDLQRERSCAAAKPARRPSSSRLLSLPLPSAASDHPATAGGCHKEILLVEDDDAIRGALGGLLAEEGYRVTCAEHGMAALQHLRSGARRPCLILLDLMMPVMDGRAFRTTQLRSPEWWGIPVILVTASWCEDLRSLQASAVLRKPLRIEELLPIVERLCATPRPAAPPPVLRAH